jgi:hypothetical protein
MGQDRYEGQDEFGIELTLPAIRRRDSTRAASGITWMSVRFR